MTTTDPLWQRTLTLWRSNLVLSVPILLADSLNYGLQSVKFSLTRGLSYWISGFFAQRSVLGMLPPSQSSMMRASLFVGGSIELLIEMAGAFFYVTAVITIARSTYVLLNDHENQEFAHLVYPTRKDLREILKLSALSLLLIAVVVAPLVVALLYFQQLTRHTLPHRESTALNTVAILPAYVSWAYLLIPRFIRLIARPYSEPSMKAISKGRKAGVVTAVALMFLSLFVMLVPFTTINSAAERYVLHWVESLVVALPYVLLSIAFGLLTNNAEMRPVFTDQTPRERPDTAPTP